MTEKSGLLSEALTPLGFRVRVTQAYWELIVTIKHPAMAGREEDVRRTLEQPDEICQSKSDKMFTCFTKQNGKNAGSVCFQANR